MMCSILSVVLSVRFQRSAASASMSPWRVMLGLRKSGQTYHERRERHVCISLGTRPQTPS